jgi:hypothetical protein
MRLTKLESVDAILTYALTTDPWPVQVGKSATVQLVVDAPREGTTSVRQLTVAIPVDAEGTAPNATNLAATAPGEGCAAIVCSASQAWDVTPGIPGEFVFAPKSRQPVDLTGQSLTITLSGIAINGVEGTASLSVREWAATGGHAPPAPDKGEAASGTVAIAVPKFRTGFHLGPFQATPADIDPGKDPSCSVVLSWAGSDDATYLIQYNGMTVEHPQGQPTQPLPPAGSYKVSNLKDDLTVFTLIVKAAGGAVAVQQQALVNVNWAKAKFEVFPDTLGQNATCMLRWRTNADHCYINGTAVDAPDGTMTVTVKDSMDFQLTALRGQDMAQEPRHVNVVSPVINSFQVLVNGQPVQDHDKFDAGTVVTLTWDTRYAETVSITPDIGHPVGASSDPKSPPSVPVDNSTTFALTCTGKNPPPPPAQVRVAVNPVQIVEFSVDPGTIDPGGTATLKWKTVRATKATIDGIGEVNALEGTAPIPNKPQSDAGYRLTCEGPDGPIYQDCPLAVNSVKVSAHIEYGPTDFDYPSLVWSTERAIGNVTISSPDGGLANNEALPMDVGPSGSVTVSRGTERDFTYRVTARGPGASPVTQEVVVSALYH